MDNNRIKITPSWEKSKEQIWQDSFAGLEDAPVKKEVFSFFRKSVVKYAAAAIFVFVLTFSALLMFPTRISAPEGSQITAYLPDSSKIILNAGSSFSYNSFSWIFKRKVKMDGEAFFEVVKGSSFKVESPSGYVGVVGTSFNVFDRAEGYRVYCLSGKVSVKSHGKSVMLDEGTSAKLVEKELEVKDINNVSDAIGWVNGIFSFNSVPLRYVIEEIERQYGIKVKYESNIDYLYTGYFSKERSPGQVLEIIGKPFGIEFIIEK